MLMCSCAPHQVAAPIKPPTIVHRVITRIVHVPTALQPTATFLDWVVPLGGATMIAGFVLLAAMEILGLTLPIRLPLAIAGMGGTTFAVAGLMRISLWTFPIVAWTMAGIVAVGLAWFIYSVVKKIRAGESPVQAVEEEVAGIIHTAPMVQA